LVAPGYEAQFVAAFSAALEERDEWARLDWQQMRPHSPLFAALPPAAQITAHEPCPVLKLHDRAPVQFSDGWRKKLDYDRRRLERTTRLRFERADSHNLDELFRALLRLHAARWQITGHSGVLADAHVRAFHAEVVSAMHASGTLRFYALRADDAIVACYYGFLTGGRAYYYLGGFDPAWERFGVGHQVVAHAIEEAAREGATEFDFLRGREPYKYRWGARDTPTRRAWLRR
jgi:CelD/BcsL family acetyltransferase involved in cellulose biosynthesis